MKRRLQALISIELEKKGDDRGFFARAFCEKEFARSQAFEPVRAGEQLAERKKGTLRGMHYQLSPKGETKLVRCIKGGLYDVILDMRKDSPTFGKSFGADLTAENRRMMYVPKGFAHGFITIEPNTEAFYFVDEFYAPEHERGVRWNDPKFKIAWPQPARSPLRQRQKPPRFRSGMALVRVLARDVACGTGARPCNPEQHTGGMPVPLRIMKILFTGASSFTGYWFVRELAAAGHEITATFRKPAAEYTDIRGKRLQQLNGGCRGVHGVSFGSPEFLESINSGGFDLLCHHAADVTNYKSRTSTRSKLPPPIRGT